MANLDLNRVELTQIDWLVGKNLKLDALLLTVCITEMIKQSKKTWTPCRKDNLVYF